MKLRVSLPLAILLLGAACGRESQSEGRANRAAAPLNAPTAPMGVERLQRERWYGDLDGIAQRRILRVSVVPNKLGYFVDGDHVQGAIYEFTREFEKFLNAKLNRGDRPISVVFIPVARERAIPMLTDGKADLIASLTPVSASNEGLVEFSEPLYDHAKAVIVTGASAPPLSSLDDLSGKQVYCHRNTVPFQKLSELSAAFEKRGKAPIELIAADENLQPEDMFEMVNAGLVPMTVGEDRLLGFWTKVLPRLRVRPNVVIAEGSLAWAMQKNTPQLKAAVDEFVRDHKIGTTYGDAIQHKYLGNVQWVKDATSGPDLARFEQLVGYFHKYGDQYSFPYLLLAAQGYQESGLNPNLKSEPGKVGVMQRQPSTAAAGPIEIPDIEKTDRNIEADAKYLRFMVRSYYADDPMTPLTKGIFAIASYHAGANRIEALRAQAAAHGYDPNRWFHNVEIVASKEIGAETVQYVGNVYKYYLAYQMVTEKKK